MRILSIYENDYDILYWLRKNVLEALRFYLELSKKTNTTIT